MYSHCPRCRFTRPLYARLTGADCPRCFARDGARIALLELDTRPLFTSPLRSSGFAAKVGEEIHRTSLGR
jgi:hypothetical protein